MTEQFLEANLNERRGMLKSVLRSAKKQIRDRLDKGQSTGENIKLRTVRKAQTKFSKEVKDETMKAMKDKFGIDGKLEDYTLAEIDVFIEYGNYLKDAYDEADQL